MYSWLKMSFVLFVLGEVLHATTTPTSQTTKKYKTIDDIEFGELMFQGRK